MASVSLRQFVYIPVLLGLALPAYGGGFTQLPEELFVPEPRPDRVAQLEQSPAPARETIVSHGREVRLVGVPFLPNPEEEIDFVKRGESSWWSYAGENLLASWLAPVEERTADVIVVDDERQLASAADLKW